MRTSTCNRGAPRYHILTKKPRWGAPRHNCLIGTLMDYWDYIVINHLYGLNVFAYDHKIPSGTELNLDKPEHRFFIKHAARNLYIPQSTEQGLVPDGRRELTEQDLHTVNYFNRTHWPELDGILRGEYRIAYTTALSFRFEAYVRHSKIYGTWEHRPSEKGGKQGNELNPSRRKMK